VIRRLLRLLGLLALAAAPSPGRAADPRLEAHLDGVLGALMETHRIPGAVAVVVRDGGVALAKGYGLADLASGRPVDPERTLFRVASVSKLFVATAVMQLVEQGKLELDADVNQTLRDFRVPAAFGAPVTLRRLLTHTAGFDDRHLGTAAPLAAEPVPLARYLAARLPPRVMPPGDLISYSNHGYGLAGHLVELASGVPFEAYVQREIFAPLGMAHSRFGFDAPAPRDLARPYALRGGRHEDLDYDRLRFSPAGALVTTGADIARFMLAQLGLGRLGDARILAEPTALEMQRTQHRLHPELPGWCLGFAEMSQNGVRAIGHGGSWRGFGTQLVLVPDADLGWFVSTNHDFHAPFHEALRNALFDHFFPRPPAPELAPPADFAARAERYAGSYLPSRRVRSDVMKLGAFVQEVRVAPQADGTLRVSTGPMAELPPLRLVELGPDRFVTLDRRDPVAFRADASGRVTHMFVGPTAFDRLSPWAAPRRHAALGAASAVLFAGTLVGFGLGALARRLGGAPPSPLGRGARGLACAVCAVDLVILVGVASQLLDVRLWDLLVAVPPALRAMLWLPLLALPLTLALPVAAARGFRPGARAPLARLHAAVLSAAALLVLAGCAYWRIWPFDLSGPG
jgi:CubicO group peptidase (beta-lactamase class C family)